MNWIDTNKELPPNDQNVLAVQGGNVHIMAYATIVEDGVTYHAWAMVYGGLDGDPEWDDNYEVTHWMPIPSPPEEA